MGNTAKPIARLQALHSDARDALDSFRIGLRLSYEQGTRVNVTYHLKQGSLALQRAGSSEVAAVLLGYIELQPQRGTEGWEGEFHAGVIAEVRAAIGAAAFDAAVARGAAKSYDEIVLYTLQEVDDVLAATDSSPAGEHA